MAAKRPVGRPSEYSEEKTIEICERIADGESLRSILRETAMPDYRTFRRWKDASPEFRLRYLRAREDQADNLMEDINDIANKATPETVQVCKLQIDTLFRWAGKVKPKKWGEKVELAHTGGTSNLNLNTSDPVEASRIYQEIMASRE